MERESINQLSVKLLLRWRIWIYCQHFFPRHIINHPFFVLTAIRDAVLVFPVPGVPVTRTYGRVLCGPFSLIMIWKVSYNSIRPVRCFSLNICNKIQSVNWTDFSSFDQISAKNIQGDTGVSLRFVICSYCSLRKYSTICLIYWRWSVCLLLLDRNE